jgi:dTDP-4-amino-4,6-dideoxygalactose transaminase
VCLTRRDELKARLEQAGIGTLVHYPVPVHLQPAYRGRLPAVVPLPQTEQLARRVLSLPLYPQLPEEQCRRVCREIIHAHDPRAGA